MPIGDDFLGWVGLNRVNRSDHLQLNPFVGVHCIPMMKAWYSLDEYYEKKYAGFRTATVAVHLGELAPDVKIFVFDGISDLDAEANRLAQTIHEFGVPWMKQHATVESILPLLREREPMLGGFPQRIAIALYLLGRHEEAAAYLDSKQEEFLAHPGWRQTTEAWARFSPNLKTHMVRHPSDMRNRSLSSTEIDRL